MLYLIDYVNLFYDKVSSEVCPHILKKKFMALQECIFGVYCILFSESQFYYL